jgi:hypothetical protein
MFSFLSRLLHQLESRPVKMALLVALGMLVSSIVLWTFINWLRRRRQYNPDSVVGLVTGSAGTLLKIFLGLAIVVAISLHLRYESVEFARKHGGVSQRNYDAVLSIWGGPYTQSEMGVNLCTYATHFYDKDGLELDADKLKATTQPIGFRRNDAETILPGNAIVQGRHEIVITRNERQKGGARYPGFETQCTFNYRVINFSDKDVVANFTFPMPAQQGVIDAFAVMIDGKGLDQKLVLTKDNAKWQLSMTPGKGLDVLVSYKSRGMDFLKLEPDGAKGLGNYSVQMTCKNMNKSDYSSPIGCMTPMVMEQNGGDLVLKWNLGQAVTRLGMGIILPRPQQESYYVGKVLDAAPFGLVLLGVMILATYLAAGTPMNWVVLLLLAAGYHLYYLLMANVGDYWPGLVGGMAIAGAVLWLLMAILHLKTTRRFTAWASLAMFAVFCFAYPLMQISDYAGLLQTILYVALLAYVIGLVLWQKRLARMTTA